MVSQASRQGVGKQRSETLEFREWMGLGGGPLGVVSLKEQEWAGQLGSTDKGGKQKGLTFPWTELEDYLAFLRRNCLLTSMLY